MKFQTWLCHNMLKRKISSLPVTTKYWPIIFEWIFKYFVINSAQRIFRLWSLMYFAPWNVFFITIASKHSSDAGFHSEPLQCCKAESFKHEEKDLVCLFIQNDTVPGPWWKTNFLSRSISEACCWVFCHSGCLATYCFCTPASLHLCHECHDCSHRLH